MFLSENEIWEYIKKGELIIEPFSPEVVDKNGLDLRVGQEYAVIKPSDEPVDIAEIKGIEDIGEVKTAEKDIILKPGYIYLINTLEFIVMPKDLIGVCCLRSTFARLGISIAPTIIDAGFRGKIVMEIHPSCRPVKIHVGDRLLHLLLGRLITPTSYTGKYQGQTTILIKPDKYFWWYSFLYYNTGEIEVRRLGPAAPYWKPPAFTTFSHSKRIKKPIECEVYWTDTGNIIHGYIVLSEPIDEGTLTNIIKRTVKDTNK